MIRIVQKNVASWFAFILLAIAWVEAPVVHAGPVQPVTGTKAAADPGQRTKELNGRPKTPVLARNTTPVATPKPESTTKETVNTEGKSTISRCWKRLMTNVREVTSRHRKQ